MFVFRWLCVLAWMAVIFAMSARPDSGDQSSFVTQLVFTTLGWTQEPEALHWFEHLLRKGSHFTEYAILALLLAWARNGLGLAAWAGATAYAATDELHQAFVPNRGPSAWDVALDSSGAATGLLVVWGLLQCWKRWRA
jgi:VanZ family protein